MLCLVYSLRACTRPDITMCRVLARGILSSRDYLEHSGPPSQMVTRTEPMVCPWHGSICILISHHIDLFLGECILKCVPQQYTSTIYTSKGRQTIESYRHRPCEASRPSLHTTTYLPSKRLDGLSSCRTDGLRKIRVPSSNSNSSLLSQTTPISETGGQMTSTT